MILKKGLYGLVSLSPILFGLLSMFMFPAFCIPLSIVLLFAAVGLSPRAEHRENLWMFVLSFLTLLPVNFRILRFLWEVLFEELSLFSVLGMIVAFGLLCSIEELLLGWITRLIWKRQYVWRQ